MIRLSTRLMLILVLSTTPALADDDCAVPMSLWQPRDAVVRLAAENGWNLRRIRIDDGCYEVIGWDATGRPIEVKLDPATLAVVEMEFEAHGWDEAEHRNGNHKDGDNNEGDHNDD